MAETLALAVLLVSRQSPWNLPVQMSVVARDLRDGGGGGSDCAIAS